MDTESVRCQKLTCVPNIRFNRPTSASMLSAIVNIGQLVTLAGPPRPRTGSELRELGLIENAALLIEKGRIVAV
jgi:hypothetical protein